MIPETNNSLDRAFQHLTLVLSFFDRAESRMSLVIGVDIAMLGSLAAAAPPWSQLQLHMFVGLLPILLITASGVYAYRGLFPDIDGPNDSLVFFGSIAGRNVEDFQKSWRECDDGRFADGIVEQIWRNARILSTKFSCLRMAFIYMLLAVVPWAGCFVVFLLNDPTAKSAIAR